MSSVKNIFGENGNVEAQGILDSRSRLIPAVAGKCIEDADMALEAKPKLFDVISALQSPSRIPSCLDCWQEQADQKGDDRNDDQQLDECECSPKTLVLLIVQAINL